MSKFQVIVGTVNGTAWKVGEIVTTLLQRLGHQAVSNEEAVVGDLVRDPDEILLICCSTTGDGNIPRNIFPVYAALDNEKMVLEGRRYGIISLGDSGFPRFAHAGLLIEDALYRCGARRVGEVFTIDAQTEDNAPLAAARWVKEWVQAFETCH